MLFKDALGLTIREARLNRGLTLRDVSKQSFIALGYLSEIERGKKEIGSAFLDGLARAIGMESYELVIEAGYRMAGHCVPDTVEQIDNYSDFLIR